MTKPLRLNSHLAPLVLKRLNTLHPLPDKGFLAGGAVANTLLSLLWGGDYPINDLDIFVRVGPRWRLGGGWQVFEGQKRSSLALNQSTDGCREESTGNYRFSRLIKTSVIGETAIGVLGASRDGLINKIRFNCNNRSLGREAEYRCLLDTFDLNACQAGISLETGKLYYTTAFAEFVATRKLKVAWSGTPLHTAIRLPKKQDELRCLCNFDVEMAYLATTAQQHEREEERQPELTRGRFFGKKYKATYDAYSRKLDPWVTVSPYSTFLGNPEGEKTGVVCLPNMYTLRFKPRAVRSAVIDHLYKTCEILPTCTAQIMANTWRQLHDLDTDSLVQTLFGEVLADPSSNFAQYLIRNRQKQPIKLKNVTQEMIDCANTMLGRFGFLDLLKLVNPPTVQHILDHCERLLNPTSPKESVIRHLFDFGQQIGDENKYRSIIASQDIYQGILEKEGHDAPPECLNQEMTNFELFGLKPQPLRQYFNVGGYLSPVFTLDNADGHSCFALSRGQEQEHLWTLACHYPQDSLPHSHSWFVSEWLTNPESPLLAKETPDFLLREEPDEEEVDIPF